MTAVLKLTWSTGKTSTTTKKTALVILLDKAEGCIFDNHSDLPPVIALLGAHADDSANSRAALYQMGVLDCLMTPIIAHELCFRVTTILTYFSCASTVKTFDTTPQSIQTVANNSSVNNSATNNSPINNSPINNLAINNPPAISDEQTLVDNTCLYLQQHLDRKFMLDDIAAFMGTNRSKLAASFKQVLGLGVFEWLSAQRMDKAKSLLSTSELSIQLIGFEVGYSNCAHFSTVYKKHFDITPSQQRKITD